MSDFLYVPSPANAKNARARTFDADGNVIEERIVPVREEDGYRTYVIEPQMKVVDGGRLIIDWVEP